jgi:alkylation response protein AidB-like acyl-CoA dehydrogenase
MNFEPIVENDLLRESVRRFFERELPEARIRDMDRARHIPRSLWKRFAAMNWMGLSVPAEFGGSGADVVTAAVFCEELARRFPSLATDWLLVSMTARVLREFASLAQKAELLPRLAAGDFLMAFANPTAAPTSWRSRRARRWKVASGWCGGRSSTLRSPTTPTRFWSFAAPTRSKTSVRAVSRSSSRRETSLRCRCAGSN